MKDLWLVLFAGLPGTGKSTLAYKLAKEKGWAILAKDQINRTLEKEGLDNGRIGYEVLLDLTELNLKNEVSIILDASFGFERLRERVGVIAKENRVRFIGVESFCSDESLLRKRFEDRREMVDGWKPVGWKEYLHVKSYWEPWEGPHLKLDAIDSPDKNYRLLLEYLNS